MSGVTFKKVSKDEDGMRVDRWFRLHYPQVRHGMLEKFLRKGQVRVDGGRVKSNTRLNPGQDIRIPPFGDLGNAQDQPSKKPLSPLDRERDRERLRAMIIYEDDDVLALNKPHGLAVQGGTNTTRHIDGMLEVLTKDGVRPRLVHRLDRDTGGVLLLAKTRKAAMRLGEAFQKHEVEKTYWALTAGAPRPREGTINMPIAKRMVKIGHGEMERVIPAEGEDARRAITDFQTMDEAGAGVAFLALKPRTGRTHQLRVHCAAIGTSIIGDGKYGGHASKIDGLSSRLHLFCRSMTFAHPVTRQALTITASLSGHMHTSWQFFGFDENAAVQWPEEM